MKKFEGTFVVSVTPMTKDEELDLESFKDNLDYYIENGIHGITINGSTGEFAVDCNSYGLEGLRGRMSLLRAHFRGDGGFDNLGQLAGCFDRRDIFPAPRETA